MAKEGKWWKDNRVLDGKVSRVSRMTGSNLISSVTSLSPSQLDQAIMGMLNIKKESLAGGICHANPISKAGKRMQLLNMLGITLIPITILLALVFAIFALRVNQFKLIQDTSLTLKFSVAVSDLVHNLQKERDLSAFYVSAIGPDTKQNLVSRYVSTDTALHNLTGWSVSFKKNGIHFRSKITLQNYLNKHRYELDSKNSTEKTELAFYSHIIRVFMNLFSDQITEAQAGVVWKQLLALQEIMDAKEMFGIERCFGSIYYIKGRFKDRNDYLQFVTSQDVANATLKASAQYSMIVSEMYTSIAKENSDQLNEIIRSMRYDIRHNPFPANATKNYALAKLWFDNMTLYMDTLLAIQNKVGIHINTILASKKSEEQRLLVGIGMMACFAVILCPSILSSVLNLTKDIQSFSATLALRTKALDKEKKRTDTLLYQMLPKEVAEQLKNNETVSAESFAETTIFFSDIVGFTVISAKSSPIQVINMLDSLYTCFDERIQLYDVHKVETIGDAYMLASGLPHRNGKRHAAEIATLSLDLLDRIRCLDIPHLPGTKFHLRIGCHTGPVVAGIVGSKMPRYCLFGNTVMLASQLEQSGAAGKVHLSEPTWYILQDMGGFVFQERSEKKKVDTINLKQCKIGSEFVGMKTFWLLDRDGMDRIRTNSITPDNGSIGHATDTCHKESTPRRRDSLAGDQISVTLD